MPWGTVERIGGHRKPVAAELSDLDGAGGAPGARERVTGRPGLDRRRDELARVPAGSARAARPGAPVPLPRDPASDS